MGTNLHIQEYIKALTTDDIKRAIEVYLKWHNGGSWDTDSKIHEMADLYFIPLGCNQITALLESYHTIAGELAKRWLNKEI